MTSPASRDLRVLVWVPMAIALVVASVIGARAWERVKTRTVRTVEVTGSAKRRISSDLVVWEASLEAHGATSQEAYQLLKAQTPKVVAYLEQKGITKDAIRVSSVTRNERFDTEVVGSGDSRVERQVSRGHDARQVVIVTSPDVARVEQVSREVTELIDAGVPVDSRPPAYFYTKLGELKIEMLAEASKDARARADRILASASGGSKIQLRAADMGVINVNAPNSTATSWEGNNDTSTIEKDIITIVHCTFDLD